MKTTEEKKHTHCECMHNTGKMLNARGLEFVGVDFGIDFEAGTTVLVLETKKMKGAPKGTKVTHLIATFCPICGARLRETA